MWFFCGTVPPIATSLHSRAYNNVWWKTSHPLILTEDPGIPLTTHALRYIAERRYTDDTVATHTAELSKAAAGSGRTIKVKEALEALFCEHDLEMSSDGEDEDTTHVGYGPQLLDVGATVRALVTYSSNKRKRSVPSSNQQMAEEEQDASAVDQDLEELQTFQQMGATAVQCNWCEKWRFVCVCFHIVPEISQEDGTTTFECHELQWCDGSAVGLSCQSYEQDFHPPNPKDTFAKDQGSAETEMKNFFEWWSKTSDTPEVEESDISVYRENYWEYLAHIGTVVPEGFADHPIHTLKVEDLGK
jgi:hypothetical protein